VGAVFRQQGRLGQGDGSGQLKDGAEVEHVVQQEAPLDVVVHQVEVHFLHGGGGGHLAIQNLPNTNIQTTTSE
jgi:hypothetical protein